MIYFLHFFFELKHLDSSIFEAWVVAHHSVFAETGDIAKIKPKFKIIAKSERMISVFVNFEMLSVLKCSNFYILLGFKPVRGNLTCLGSDQPLNNA